MAASLLERGIFCPAIRPPTVPPGTSRLRISLTAEHAEEDVDLLVRALVAARDKK
jgi:7-keto-8-aminopelargonate synthetase-like enzyme